MTQSSTVFTANIIVSSGKVWRWQLQIIQSLQALGLIDVCNVVSNNDSSLITIKPVKWLQQCDAKIFRSPLNAFDVVEADALLNKQSKSSLDKVDILINFSESKVASELFNSCEFGVLETRFSAAGELNSQTLATTEYLAKLRQVYIGVTLTDCHGKTVALQESKPSLDKGSITRNLNEYLQLIDLSWQRAIKKVAVCSNEINRFNLVDSTSLESAKTSNSLSIIDTLKLSQRFGSNVLDKLLQKYKQNEQWILLLQFRDEKNTTEAPLSFSDYIEIIPPKDVFWADPFVVSEAGRHYVFFEELPFETERGHLSCMEVFSDGSYSTPKVILKQPFHLSFPNVFQHDSTYYMIPESGDKGAIELYHCTDFPYQWERKHTLIEGLHAYDSTLVEHDGRWWLFATVAAKQGMSGNEELHIFYADSPISTDWKAHVANPVICDASTARPAGQFYKVGDDLFRPSQDCAGHYGAGLNINKIIQLDTDQYVEQQVTVCRPDWKENLTALHTLNFNNDVAVADALRVTSKGVF